LRQAFRDKRGGDSSVKALSDRELYVFQLLGAGLASRKIATQLGVSLKTVESHRENIKRKLGLRDGAELVRHAFQFVDTPFVR
jgi:DNA-binding NarL/FixJ family response regulator